MSLFAKAQSQATNVKVEEKDTLGGGGFTIVTGIHPTAIKMAYLDAWNSGALFVALELVAFVDGQEKTHKENITISNKAGEFTYKDKDGNPQPMPGYAMVDTLFRLATGKGFNEQDVQVKSVSVYDREVKGNVNKEKEVFMDVLRQKVQAGIILQKVDKTALNQATGKYDPTGETREENVLSKVFDFETFQTITEKAANKPAEFHKGWTERFAGKTIDKSKGKPAGTGGAVAGAPNQAAAENPLFG